MLCYSRKMGYERIRVRIDMLCYVCNFIIMGDACNVAMMCYSRKLERTGYARKINTKGYACNYITMRCA